MGLQRLGVPVCVDPGGVATGAVWSNGFSRLAAVIICVLRGGQIREPMQARCARRVRSVLTAAAVQ
jgi:hypothetical protein